MDICVEHPAVRNGVETPLGEGVVHGPTLAERTRGTDGRLRIPNSQMTVISGSPAYETLHTIFEWKSPDAGMRLRPARATTWACGTSPAGPAAAVSLAPSTCRCNPRVSR